MCVESHWRAASNKGRKTAKLDETGLEIAGCRHGLAQWAVNMYQGGTIWLCQLYPCQENDTSWSHIFLGGYCL